MKLELRKFNKFVDKTFIEGGKKAKEPVLLVSVAAVFRNPWADKGFVEDLKRAFPKPPLPPFATIIFELDSFISPINSGRL